MTDEGTPEQEKPAAPEETPPVADGGGGGGAGDADALFEALWSRVVEAWDDDKPHAAILQHALENQRLPDLAGRYRKIKAEDEAKAARAQKKIDGIVLAATQMLMATKTPPRPSLPWTWTASFALGCALIIGWLTYRVLFYHR